MAPKGKTQESQATLELMREFIKGKPQATPMEVFKALGIVKLSGHLYDLYREAGGTNYLRRKSQPQPGAAAATTEPMTKTPCTLRSSILKKFASMVVEIGEALTAAQRVPELEEQNRVLRARLTTALDDLNRVQKDFKEFRDAVLVAQAQDKDVLAHPGD